MDPYIEHQAWGDFHLMFTSRLRAALGRLLPDPYYVRAEEYVYLVRNDESRGVIRPDSFGYREKEAPPAGAGAVALLEAPVTVPLPELDYVMQRSLAIRARGAERVVCVIEFLSPTNKDGDTGHVEYLRKRLNIFLSSAHLVEIDLLRAGLRPPTRVPLPPVEYYTLVSRSDMWPECGVWPIGLREALPIIPVPLSNGDPDVRLDLQAIFEETYESCGYPRSLDYRHGTNPPLAPEDAAWADERLCAAGLL
jgi:hypothetical protein